MEKIHGVYFMSDLQVNLQHVVDEITDVFYAYEKALMSNDVIALRAYFWDDPRVTRYGIADKQWGIDELDAYRQSVPTPEFTRELSDLRITTVGESFATVQVEFVRSDSDLRGFQTQSWVKFNAGWKIISAHVSMIAWES
jgi:hypothetical protein